MKDTPAYPLLERVAEIYGGVELKDTLLLASQHLLEPQQKMFKILLHSGLKPQNCVIAGKSYSTNPGIMRSLISQKCAVAPFSHSFNPLRHFDDWYAEKLLSFVAEQIEGRRLNDYRKIIILDDGGFMHSAVNALCGKLPNIVGIEQTSSGWNRIKKSEISFNSIPVARLHQKQCYESPHIGRHGAKRIITHIKKRGNKKPLILIMGLGAIGRQIAGQLLLKSGYDGYATDIDPDRMGGKENILTQLMESRNKLISHDEAMSTLERFNVIIGASGYPVLTETDVNRLHPEVSLISMSSSDREFPALSFRNSQTELHDDCYQQKQCLVNGGFPITFYGNRREVPPSQIELTIALLQIFVMHHAKENFNSHPLPYAINQIYDMWKPREL
jgi:hypothetical protein